MHAPSADGSTALQTAAASDNELGEFRIGGLFPLLHPPPNANEESGLGANIGHGAEKGKHKSGAELKQWEKHITHIADANNDGCLEHQELVDFAHQ